MKLRRVEGGVVSFHCPGCKGTHCIPIEGPHKWTFNGNLDRPSLSPSVRESIGHFAPGSKPGDDCWCTYNVEQQRKGEKPAPFRCGVCHFVLTDGALNFCDDCTHELKGKKVSMEDVA